VDRERIGTAVQEEGKWFVGRGGLNAEIGLKRHATGSHNFETSIHDKGGQGRDRLKKSIARVMEEEANRSKKVGQGLTGQDPTPDMQGKGSRARGSGGNRTQAAKIGREELRGRRRKGRCRPRSE